LNPTSSLLADKSLINKAQDMIKHVELHLQYEADLADKDVYTRRNAAAKYANQYKSLIDPNWEVGSSDVGTDKRKSGYYIHEYIREIMTNWYTSLYPDIQKKIKGSPALDFFSWWSDLPNTYGDDNYVQNALNATYNLYYEPQSGTYASIKNNIKTAADPPKVEKDNPYARMNVESVTLYNLGLETNEFPYFESDMTFNGEAVTFYNPEKQKLNELLNNLQKALVGDSKKEDQEKKKREQELDITGPLNFLTNLMNYKGGRI
jgi:hypothetical protein